MKKRTIDALRKWLDDRHGTFSARELAAEMGVSHSYANILLNRDIEDGLVEYAGKLSVKRRDGGEYRVPVFRRVSE